MQKVPLKSSGTRILISYGRLCSSITTRHVPFAGTSKLLKLVEPRRVDVKFARKMDKPIIMIQLPDLNKTLDIFNLPPASLKRKDRKK